MPYRHSEGEPYSLVELSPTARVLCAVLTSEMLRIDRPGPVDVGCFLDAAGADESFRDRLRTALKVRVSVVERSGVERWRRFLEGQIDELRDPEAQAVIIAFLTDLATLATIKAAESELLGLLRERWALEDREPGREA